VHETGLFSPAVYLCFQRHPNKLVRKVTPVFAIIFAFAFRKKTINGSNSYNSPQPCFENIGTWRGAHILLSFSVPEPSEYCCMTDLKDKYSPAGIVY
jgi:hypothetical protein